MIGDWLPEERLEVFLRAVSQFVDYRFDESDWLAITTQLQSAGDQSLAAAEYDLASVRIALEADHDGGVVIFKIEAPPEVEERIIGAHAALQLLD